MVLLGASGCHDATGGAVVDGSLDATPDAIAMIDARPEALTCHEPGNPGLGPYPGTTVGHANNVAAMCGGAVHSASDAVYRVQLPGATPLRIDIAGDHDVTAYFVSSSNCQPLPAMPLCENNQYATPGNPITIGPFMPGSLHFIVVDGIDAAASGSYTLTITNP